MCDEMERAVDVILAKRQGFADPEVVLVTGPADLPEEVEDCLRERYGREGWTDVNVIPSTNLLGGKTAYEVHLFR